MTNDIQKPMNGEAPATDSTTDPSAGWPVLNPMEARVLGCLMEKAMATPGQYPLTLNALVNACNQKSNREPVMSLSEAEVVQSLDTLRHRHGLAALAHTAGSRVEKFKHTVSSVISPINPMQAAILCELLLRGPETVGELRTRAARLHPFESLDDVQRTLQDLASNPGGALVVKLAREPGRREFRWMHVLGGLSDVRLSGETGGAEAPEVGPSPESDERTDELRRLRAELDELKSDFAAFRKQFE